MSRFFAPFVAFGVAGYVAWANAQQNGQVLYLIGTDLIVGSNTEAQGRITWQLLVAFGVLSLGIALRARVSASRNVD